MKDATKEVSVCMNYDMYNLEIEYESLPIIPSIELNVEKQLCNYVAVKHAVNVHYRYRRHKKVYHYLYAFLLWT